MGILAEHSDRFVDSLQQRLPETHRGRWAQVPRYASRTLLALVFGVLMLLPIGLVALVLRGTRSPTVDKQLVSAQPIVSTPIRDAGAEVPAVPRSLDEKSKDPDVLLELALERMRNDKESEALGLVLRALGYQPARRNDERVASILYRTAKSATRDTADKSFSVLQGVMAAKGAEILYQLWLDRGLRDETKRRVDRWIRSESLDRSASGAIALAVKLRLADSCERKAALLPPAGRIGGAAVLSYLKELGQPSGCGLTGQEDCYPCLRQDSRLKEAIGQIQARLDDKSR